MIEQGNNNKSCVQLDFVSGKYMTCLVCLFLVAAGSMPVICMLLWTEGRRVNCYMYV